MCTIKAPDNERQLLLDVAKGDQRAFAMLFRNYVNGLADYVYRITESQEVAEEIVQDVFTIIWQKRSTLGELESFSNYIFIISKNKTLNYLRQHAADHNRQLEWQRQLEQEFDHIEELSRNEELYQLVEEVVEMLPAQQKRVYYLSRVERLKYGEIAAKLGLSRETVKKHMQLALGFLRSNVKSSLEKVVSLSFLNFIFFF